MHLRTKNLVQPRRENTLSPNSDEAVRTEEVTQKSDGNRIYETMAKMSRIICNSDVPIESDDGTSKSDACRSTRNFGSMNATGCSMKRIKNTKFCLGAILPYGDVCFHNQKSRLRFAIPFIEDYYG